MGASFKIGRAFGIDVQVHWTFFLLLAFFAFAGYQRTGSLINALVTTVVIVALFLCVVLHEFGHSLVAQRLGIETKDITLLPIGGVARLKSLPERPMDEVKIAVAGPLVNVVLAPVFFAIGLLLGASPLQPANILEGSGSVGQVFVYLGLINVALVVFNMIPAFPMDGGRVLRGLLASRLGPVRATDISSAVGQFFALAFFLIGLLNGNFLLALVAVFIFFGANGEAQMVRQRELMRGLAVSDVMGTRPRLETVTPYHTFGQVLDSIIHGYQEDFPVVDEEGDLVGMITRNEIMAAAHSPDRYSSVRDLMKTDFPTISPDADLFTDGARILQESGLRALPVVKAGDLVGMLTMDDIGQAALLRDPRKRASRNPAVRVASLLPSATEMVHFCGAGEALIGVTHECDYPIGVQNLPHLTSSKIEGHDMTSAEIDAAIGEHLTDTGSIYALDAALLEELAPDLIITQGLCEVCAVSVDLVGEAVAGMEREPEVLSLNPTSLRGVLGDTLRLGEALGRGEESSAKVAALEERFARVESAVAGLPRPRVGCIEWLDPPFSAGHWVPEMVRIAGGEEVLAEPGESSSRLAWKEVFEAAPEVLVLMPCGFDAGRAVEEAGHALSEISGWEDLPAVRKGRVWAVDANSYFSRPAPRLVEGVEILARILHPEAFAGAPDPRDAVRLASSRSGMSPR